MPARVTFPEKLRLPPFSLWMPKPPLAVMEFDNTTLAPALGVPAQRSILLLGTPPPRFNTPLPSACCCRSTSPRCSGRDTSCR